MTHSIGEAIETKYLRILLVGYKLVQLPKRETSMKITNGTKAYTL